FVMICHAFEQGAIANPLQVVRDGEEAVAYLNGDGKYDDRVSYPLPVLMLLDLQLPRMDGFQVLRWVRLQSGFKALPVIVLTGSSAMKDVTLAYQCGANSFLVKQTDFQDVVRMSQNLASYWLALSQGPDTTIPASIPPPKQL